MMEEEPICRVCMQSHLLLDWNNRLFPFNDCKISYKDCYYKYTQIEEMVSDPQYLCEYCSTDLKKVHLFIEKAIASNKSFLQSIQNTECCEVAGDDCELEATESDFLHEEEHNKHEEDDDSKVEYTEEYQVNANSAEFDLIEVGDDIIEETQDAEFGYEVVMEKDEIKVEEEEVKDPIHVVETKMNNDANESEDKVCKPKKRAAQPAMCSYCSKIIHDVYYLKVHEQTHKEYRERVVECPKCGFKTFSKNTLRMHMECHDENREKKYKCEFCDKAFFHRGSCNVHRRIHLGQSVKCSICAKEFPRQIDVDLHMKSHSNSPLYMKHRSRHLVHCKYCNKNINGRKFYEHRAKHLNQPLIRCTLCEKDFFSRQTCTSHMTRVHKRTKGNYDDIAMYYEKFRMRLSHKVLLQQEEVIPKTA
ncbi:uncharacterized protein [Musca autumnalis]|uniref:uncharacterized protein n=1 Tax=Musca autumnalis TaxID=221902 RepID=UPI003CF7F924